MGGADPSAVPVAVRSGTLVVRRNWFSTTMEDTDMLPISQRSFTGTSKPAVALVVLALFPADLAAQGLPVETGSHFPVALWFIGVAVLGLAIAYGIMRNRSRTRAEKHITEKATKNAYAEENRDRVGH